LSSEDLVGGFDLKSDLSLLEENTKNLTLMFSEDDDVVPPAHAKKYQKHLSLKAHVIVYKSKNGHFNISKFPEILKMIKADIA
jgi:predicted alpha/beta hydrolase family esterase